jgi:hypothetical protein
VLVKDSWAIRSKPSSHSGGIVLCSPSIVSLAINPES